MSITKDYNPFYPFNNPTLGNVLSVSIQDCADSTILYNVTDLGQKKVKVDIVGGNECVVFDNTLKAFT